MTNEHADEAPVRFTGSSKVDATYHGGGQNQTLPASEAESGLSDTDTTTGLSRADRDADLWAYDELSREAARLRAQVAAVEALAHEFWLKRDEPQGPDSWYSGMIHARNQIRAALASVPTPASVGRTEPKAMAHCTRHHVNLPGCTFCDTAERNLQRATGRTEPAPEATVAEQVAARRASGGTAPEARVEHYGTFRDGMQAAIDLACPLVCGACEEPDCSWCRYVDSLVDLRGAATYTFPAGFDAAGPNLCGHGLPVDECDDTCAPAPVVTPSAEGSEERAESDQSGELARLRAQVAAVEGLLDGAPTVWQAAVRATLASVGRTEPVHRCSCGTPGLNYAGPERDCPIHGEERWCESCQCMVPVVDESDEQIGYEEQAREVRVVHMDCAHDIVTEKHGGRTEPEGEHDCKVWLKWESDAILYCGVCASRFAATDVVGRTEPAPEAGGVALIAAERQRQMQAEGWTPAHDAEHDQDELAKAAIAYALPDRMRWVDRGDAYDWVPRYWPWDASGFKPSRDDRVRELVKAGALLAAEIDRLATPTPVSSGEAGVGERGCRICTHAADHHTLSGCDRCRCAEYRAPTPPAEDDAACTCPAVPFPVSSSGEAGTGEACPLDAGERPYWMGVDQYDPCKCLLTKGHEPPCVCSHTAPADTAPESGEGR